VKSILDRTFQYTPAAKTDLKKTFTRARREQREQERRNEEAALRAADKVKPIKGAKA
jgi:hypothetical protein